MEPDTKAIPGYWFVDLDLCKKGTGKSSEFVGVGCRNLYSYFK